jgi:tetratricopeptide (TPR) repeat protein
VSYLLGETYQAKGQSAQAAAEYRRSARLGPADSLPLLALGRLQWSGGQEAAALQSFRAAVDVTPGSGQAQVALANALLALGERDTAAEHFQLALAAEGVGQEGTVYDFAAHLAEASIELPDPNYVRGDYFSIDGDDRRVIFSHPDAAIRYSVAVDDGVSLVFSVGTAPGSWAQPGDGVGFAVYVETGEGTHEAFRTYVDPKHNPSDRRWHAHEVDLSPFAGQTVAIVFQTGPGAAGDYQFDWAGWGEPRLKRGLCPRSPVRTRAWQTAASEL